MTRIRVRKSNHNRLKRLVLRLADCSWHMPDCPVYVAFENKADIEELINNTPCTCGNTKAWIKLFYASYLPAKELHKQRTGRVYQVKFSSSERSDGMTELLPCPFCGGEAEVYNEDEFVECTKCWANVELWGLGNSVTAWNRRSQSIQDNDGALKLCPLCGDVAYSCILFTGKEYKYFIECDGDEDDDERRRCKCESALCDTHQEAEDAWNERVGKQVQAIKIITIYTQARIGARKRINIKDAQTKRPKRNSITR